MKYFSAIFCTFLILLSLGLARDVELPKEEQTSIIYNSQVYNLDGNPVHQDPNQTREQIDLILDDFETTAGDWDPSEGWTTNTTEYHSETTSYHAADYLPTDENGEPTYKSWDLFSPLYTLPELGDGETMHFDFWLNLDMPGAECDGDNYLDDYYGVSILDIASLAWHTSDYNSTDGPNWFCGFEDIGNGSPGYLDAWVQYLDTPAFTVPDGGTISADMWWGIEDPAGAVVSGTYTDGWDQANVQISVDGGATFSMLESAGMPYDFGCGYGMVYNGLECNVVGDCPGWGGYSPGLSGWNNVSFDLAAFAGEDAIVRFAFYSDPAYSSVDEPTATGFQVDNIVVSDGAFSDTADDEDAMAISGAVWVDQFYDYWDDGTTYDPRPGSNGWEQYVPGLPFNGNVFMDISDFAGKDVIFRFQTRLGELTGACGEGEGMFVDDFRVYKESGGSYPTPSGLTAESGDSEVTLSWTDMNGSGTADFDYTNGEPTTGIQMATSGSTAFAGERIDLVGASTINTVSVHLGPNEAGATTTLAVFGMLGSLFNNEPLHTQEITLNEGWNDFDVNLDMNNGYIIATQFTNVDETEGGVYASLDETATPSTNSMVLFSGGSWDLWSVAGASVGDGEWGIKANISYSGAGVTYNVYRDGDPSAVASGLDAAMHTDTGLENNQEYYYQVTATYGDGTESDYSEVVFVTPFSNTVHEVAHDDGSAEGSINAGSGNATAVKYTACSDGELLNRFKWYQTEDAGAFYIKVYADDNGAPGEEELSVVVAGGLVSGWNEKDLLGQGMTLSGDFWLGIREFSSTRPIGLDTSSDAGMSMTNESGSWESVAGNVMIRALLDEVNCGSVQCGSGDVNADGNVDVLDVVQVVNFIVGSGAPDDDQACAADMNEDGNVDVLDVVQMVNMIIN